MAAGDRPGPLGPTEAVAVECWELWSHKGWSVRQVQAEMKKRGLPCSSTSTATAWINKGREIESVSGGPLSRTKAQREKVAAAFDALRAVVIQDVEIGRVERAPGYRLLHDILRSYAQLLGLNKPVRVNVKSDGDRFAPIDENLLRSLLAVPPDELRDETPE